MVKLNGKVSRGFGVTVDVPPLLFIILLEALSRGSEEACLWIHIIYCMQMI